MIEDRRPQPTSATALNYLETRLRTCSPVELTVILYDLLLESLGRGAEAAEAGRIEERVRATNRAAAAVTELRCSLDMERGGDIASSLSRLYAYALTRLATAIGADAGDELRALHRLFAPLRDAWAEVAGATPAPVARTATAVPAEAVGVGVAV